MTEKRKYRKKELEDFLRYTQDQMSETERNAFERSLHQDPFSAEALEGLSSLAPEEARADLARLQDRLQGRVSLKTAAIRNSRVIWYRVAAAVAVLLVISSVLFTIFNDRVGQLDRKVAESPGTEKEEPVPVSPLGKTPAKLSEDVTPVQTGAADKKPETFEEVEETIPLESREREKAGVLAETKVTTSDEKAFPDEAAAEATAGKTLEEEPARRELVDVPTQEETDIRVAELAEKEEADVAEVAAPAAAMERPSVARSRKREAAAPLQKAVSAGSQRRTISGLVIAEEDKQPLPGAVVAVRGSDTGTLTDLNGRFEISIKDDTDKILIARFIGMEPKEIPIGKNDELIITMEPDATSLEQAAVVERGPGGIAQPAGYSVNLAEYDVAQGKSAYHEALPAGGMEEFNKYIRENLQFPIDEKNLTRTSVVLSFIVGEDGRPAQVAVLRSPGKAFSDEAIRLLINGPDWNPALKNGKYFEQPARIQIAFTKE